MQTQVAHSLGMLQCAAMAGRACRLHVRLQADPECALVHFLKADHVCIVAQNLLHNERTPILGRKPPAGEGWL